MKGGSLPEGIEIFPKHDRLKSGEFGNAIRGPLGVHRGAARRYWFYGADYELEKQMAYLKHVPKVSAAQLEVLIAGKAIPPELEGRKPQPEVTRMRSRNGSGGEFR